MSLAERRCRRLASCWRTTSGSAALQVTPALLVAPLLRVLELWCEGSGHAALPGCMLARVVAILQCAPTFIITHRGL